MERRKKFWAIAAAIGCLSFCSTAAGNDIPDFILATALTSDEISAARKALAIKEDAIKTVKTDYLPKLTAEVSGGWVREGKKTSALVDRFADAALVVIKGDANYRRLLGERKWQLDTRFKDALSYFQNTTFQENHTPK